MKTIVGPLQSLLGPQLGEMDKFGALQLDRVCARVIRNHLDQRWWRHPP